MSLAAREPTDRDTTIPSLLASAFADRRGSQAVRALRAATAGSHARLDCGLRLAMPGAGRHTYARYAAAMWGWMQPVEAAVWSGPWPDGVSVPLRAVKSRWLEEDLLRARQQGFLEGEIARRDHRFPFLSLAGRIGYAYVTESLMLGAQALRARVAPTLHPWPARFLVGYGDDSGALWREFVAVIDAELDTGARIEEATRCAARAFESLESWFQAQGAA